MRNTLRSLTLLGLVVFCVALNGSAQQPPPAPDKSAPGAPGGDKLQQPSLRNEHPLYGSLEGVINQGVVLFNDKADYAGCYRLFQGAIIAVRPYLANDPDFARFVDDSLKSAEKLPRVTDRAFALRSVLDSIRDRYRPEGAKPSRPLPGTDPGKKPVETIPVPKKGEKTPNSTNNEGTKDAPMDDKKSEKGEMNETGTALAETLQVMAEARYEGPALDSRKR